MKLFLSALVVGVLATLLYVNLDLIKFNLTGVLEYGFDDSNQAMIKCGNLLGGREIELKMDSKTAVCRK